MDRYWFLTWTTYGTWLPGDKRGFVSDVGDDRAGKGVRHNVPGTEYDADHAGLRRYMAERLKCAPVYLNREQAVALLPQLLETGEYRHWLMLAVAIMANHTHVVVGVPGDLDPESLLRDLKSYGSRKLNQGWGKPPSGTWWTQSGSKRKLPVDPAVVATVKYVYEEQEFPLVSWKREGH
ncbi:MAG: transposase [Planctomycetia bacterium]|nr:transposase [Planctomycetia bacterium]